MITYKDLRKKTWEQRLINEGKREGLINKRWEILKLLEAEIKKR